MPKLKCIHLCHLLSVSSVQLINYTGGELASKRLRGGTRFPFVCPPRCFQAHGAYLQVLFAVGLLYEGDGESWTSVVVYKSLNLE